MNVTEYTVKQIILWHWHYPQTEKTESKKSPISRKFDLFFPLRKWVNSFEVNDPHLAHRICQLIPCQCPFHRTVKVWGRKIVTIPPLCKLNPLYEEVVGLRLRALSYLVEECGEDVSKYC